MAEVIAACVMLSLIWGALRQHPRVPRSLLADMQSTRRRAHRGLRRRQTWRAAATALGMPMVQALGSWTIAGIAGRARLCAAPRDGDPEASECVVRITHPGIPHQLCFEAHPWPLADRARAYVPGLPLRVCVTAHDELVALAAFGESARAVLDALPGRARLRASTLEVTVPIDLDVESARRTLDAALALTQALAFDPLHLDARLAQHALEDHDAEMRCMAFAGLRRRFPGGIAVHATAMHALHHEDRSLRMDAVEVLGLSRTAAEVARDITRDASAPPHARRRAIRFLHGAPASVGGFDTLAVVHELLTQGMPEHQKMAMRLIVELGLDVLLGDLRDQTRSMDVAVACAAVRALVEVAGANAEAELIAVLKERVDAAAATAASELGRCGGGDALAELERHARQPHAYQQSYLAARAALRAIHARHADGRAGGLSLVHVQERQGALSAADASCGGLSFARTAR